MSLRPGYSWSATTCGTRDVSGIPALPSRGAGCRPMSARPRGAAGAPWPRQPPGLPPRRHPHSPLAHRLPDGRRANPLPPRLSPHRRPQPHPRQRPRAGRHAPDRPQEPGHLRPVQHHHEQELLEAGDQLVVSLARQLRAAPTRRRPHAAGTAPRSAPPLCLVRRRPPAPARSHGPGVVQPVVEVRASMRSGSLDGGPQPPVGLTSSTSRRSGCPNRCCRVGRRNCRDAGRASSGLERADFGCERPRPAARTVQEKACVRRPGTRGRHGATMRLFSGIPTSNSCGRVGQGPYRRGDRGTRGDVAARRGASGGRG